jgi:uncharacterized protein with PIN domain
MCQRFLIDQMLMRLGRWLRLMGQDVANPPKGDDHKLVMAAKGEGRTLITRDRVLAEKCRKAGIGYVLIKSSNIEDQLKEMGQSGVRLEINPLKCTLCNGSLRRIGSEEADIRRKLLHLDEETPIWMCEDCRKLYWVGTHWTRIRERLEDIRSGQI